MAGVERYLQDVDAARGQLQRVLDRLGEQRAHGNCTSLAYPLDAQLVVWRGRDVVEDFDPRHFDCGRQQIVGEGAIVVLGVKGVGEAGAIPVGALFAQAIEDALELPACGIEILEVPLDPGRLWELAGGAG